MHIESMFIVGTIAVTSYKVLELFAHRRERLNVVEKLESRDLAGSLNGQMPSSFNSGNLMKYPSFVLLRICFLALGAGLGLVVSGLLQMYCFADSSYFYVDFVGIGVTLFFIALSSLGGFITEYILVKKLKK